MGQVDSDESINVRAAVAAMVDEGLIPGATWALVTGSGSARRVHVESSGAYDDDTIFRVASLTKPIAGVLATALVSDGIVALDDPIERWVPETAERPVLMTPMSPLDEVEPAVRGLTVGDVVGMGAGLGWAEAVSGSPLERAVDEQGLTSTWVPSSLDPDEWARRLGTLPMAHQPGRGWLYQMSYDLLTIVLERAAATPIAELLHERVLRPAGMTETGWTVSPDQVHRVPAQFFPDENGDRVQAAPASDPSLCERPAFCSLATGLLSTAADLARLGELFLDLGRGSEGQVVSAEAMARLSTDLLGTEARTMGRSILGPDRSWGFGVGIDTAASHPGSYPGRFGWDGGTGTSMWTDPTAEVSAVLLTQQGMGPDDAHYIERFWAAVHA